MLGFDALGRLALGEIPAGDAQNVVLWAESGAYQITGKAAAGPLSMVAGQGSYVVTGSAAHLLAAADSGAYALTGAGVALDVQFVAAPGSYAVTGRSVAFGTALAADPGSYAVTGKPAEQRFAAGSGSYLVEGAKRLVVDGGALLGFGALSGDALGATGHATFVDATKFSVRFVAAPGSYAVTLGAFELRRTGYDWPPDQYGIGHVKLAMAEVRRRAVVIKPTPRPVLPRLPALPQYVPPVPVVPPVPGLVGDTGFADRLEAAQVERTARAEALRKQQARNRAVAVLLLAA